MSFPNSAILSLDLVIIVFRPYFCKAIDWVHDWICNQNYADLIWYEKEKQAKLWWDLNSLLIYV